MRKVKVRLDYASIFFDYTKNYPDDEVWIIPGVYEVERVPNPGQDSKSGWCIFVGTTVGASEEWFLAKKLITTEMEE